MAAMAEETNDGLSCKLLILSNSTADVSEQSKTLLDRQKKDGGWGLVESKRGAIPDTVQAVKALLASKKAPASAMNNAGDFLVKAQQADGAWIFTDELSLSDTIHTAMVLIVLQDLRGGGYLSGSGLEQATAKAQKYLEAKGSADGFLWNSARYRMDLPRLLPPETTFRTSINTLLSPQPTTFQRFLE